MEAITSLADGRILTLTELYTDEDSRLRGWLLQGRRFDSVLLARDDPFSLVLSDHQNSRAFVRSKLKSPRPSRSMNTKTVRFAP